MKIQSGSLTILRIVTGILEENQIINLIGFSQILEPMAAHRLHFFKKGFQPTFLLQKNLALFQLCKKSLYFFAAYLPLARDILTTRPQ